MLTCSEQTSAHCQQQGRKLAADMQGSRRRQGCNMRFNHSTLTLTEMQVSLLLLNSCTRQPCSWHSSSVKSSCMRRVAQDEGPRSALLTRHLHHHALQLPVAVTVSCWQRGECHGCSSTQRAQQKDRQLHRSPHGSSRQLSTPAAQHSQ